MTALATLLFLAASLVPTKTYFNPSQPPTVTVNAEKEMALVLTNFAGEKIEAKGSADVSGEKSVNLKEVFPQIDTPGTYILYLTPKGSGGDLTKDFVGTPLLVRVYSDNRPEAKPMLVKIEPLRYVVMKTSQGDVTFAFFYDATPNTVQSFLSLAEGGYFDGLIFHRVLKGFVIQGGDPLGYDPQRAGTGGPGYQIDGEFNTRPHLPGMLSMARSNDPNSAGGQFFVCLDYTSTKQLDQKYTVFGKTVAGMDAVNKIANTPVDAPDRGRPIENQTIEKMEVKPVTPGNNPYATLFTEAEKETK